MGKFLRAISVNTGPLSLDLAHFVRDYCPNAQELYVTSAYRPGDPGHHGGLWYKASRTAAVDFGAYDDPEPNAKDQRDMGLAADWLFEHFWDLTVELIHTQPHNNHFTYVKNQKKVGAYAASTHVNHIHFATSRKLFKKMKARAKAKWGAPGGTTEPKPAPSKKYDDKASPIFGCDVYDFTVNDGLTEAAVRDLVGKGGLKFINAKIAEMDRNGNTWVHTKALRMLNVAKEAGLPFPMGFVVPRTGVSPQALMNLAEKALDQHCPWWRNHPTFSIQVDTERWGHDSVSLDKGVQVAKYIRDTMKRRVVAIYAPDWGYEGSRGPISKVKAAKFGWWASEYAGSGASRNYKDMYNGAGGANGPGWRVVDGVKPVLNQFCSDGRVPGYSGKLVMTAFNGTAHEFAQYLGADASAPTEEFEDMDKEEFRENVKYAIAELLAEGVAGETKRGRWLRRRLSALVVEPVNAKVAAVAAAVKELASPTLPPFSVVLPEQELDVAITPDWDDEPVDEEDEPA